MSSFTAFLAGFSLLLSNAYASSGPIVQTTHGPVSGTVATLGSNTTVTRFLGIPFAKAERFEYPVAPDKWTSVLNANKTDKICPQITGPLPPGKAHLPPMSEDCLQLSVYIPGNVTRRSPLAVMLWIHGGSYLFGDTLSYDASILATEGDVVVVTTAYRLGVFGFLSSNSDDLRGNYGMMDQIAAMRWVKQNIASFGGDPNKVTIFGESAGGMSVALLLLSPLANGLYQNAILQSGTAVTLVASLERDEADLRARSFSQALGCPITSLKECAKKKSVEDILVAQSKIFPQLNYLQLAPVVDGYVLPDSPTKLLQAGKFNKTNVVIGWTRDDGSMFPAFAYPNLLSKGMSRPFFKEAIRNVTWTRHQNSHLHEILIYKYTDWSNASDPYALRQGIVDINTDAIFKAPAILTANAFLKRQLPTYLYQLEKIPKVFPGFLPMPEWSGIYHGADIFYLFGGPFTVAKNLTSAADMKLGKDIMTLWTNFAKTGNPNNPTPLATIWPQYTADLQEFLGLGSNFTVRSKMLPDKMALWNKLAPSIQEIVMPTSKVPHTVEQTDGRGNKDKLVLVLAILTGVFGALAVILLVLLIVSCFKRRRREKADVDAPMDM